MARHSRAVAWASEQLGSEVVEVGELTGGWTSTMLAITTATGTRAVLRLMTREPWRTHGAELTTREHETQLMLAATDVPAPRSIALDATGEQAGDPAHLMSLLPGTVDLRRSSPADLVALARTLVAVHAVRPAVRPRTYQSWAVPAKQVVPPWAREPEAWERAFAVLAQDPPPYDGTFLHRDFSPRNLLWSGDRLTGIVDWVETSWGPAWLDVAHCRTILAIHAGIDAADRFGAEYVALTGRGPQPYFDLMDVVGLLPHPDRVPFLSDPQHQVRVEAHLVSLL
jgi:aminoglycoside phosphotransferase (APT) family kinase protein